MIVALYARVSTRDQDELMQLPRLREAANARGYEIYQEYTDEASGRDGNRPGWLALLSDAKAGRFDAVFVVKLDRVMRSLQIFLRELENFASMNVSIISLDYGDLSPRSASGKLTIQFLAAIAEWEREINSERTKEALAAKKAKGVVLGRPKKDFPTRKVALLWLHSDKPSWAEIARIAGVPRTTIYGHLAEIKSEIDKIQSS